MRKDGFTLIELIVTIAVLGIMVAIAIPGFSSWLPDYRLKGAARELYASMQMARMGAVKSNSNWAIVLDKGTNTFYVCSNWGADGDWTTTGDNTVEKEVDLTPENEHPIYFGHGSATTPIGTTFGDDITYSSPDNVAVFNPRGTGSNGYVYLENNKNTTTYGVGTLSSGVVRLLKWNSSASEWE